MAEVSLERRICVHVHEGEGNKTYPWALNKVDTVDGIEFIKLQKADRGFLRFLGSERYKSIENLIVLDQIRHLRSQATMKSVVDAEANALFGDTKRQTLLKRAEAHKAAERGELPSMVTIALPEFRDSEGNVWPSLECKVIACLDPRQPVSVELRSVVLQHLRELVRNYHKEEDASGPASSANCRWMRDRKAFIAKRMENGKMVCKTFRPEADTEDAKVEARCKGLAWTRFEEDEDDNEGEENAEMGEEA